jgi:geranylgeranyl diphosphate synthase, type II
MSTLNTYLEKCKITVEETLEDLLPKETERPSSIHELMRYSMFAGGKRIRPALILATNEACGGEYGNKNACYAGVAVEMLHTFSLIHDDLPCMDDDDFRRGKPTAHKAFNEGLAVLGGDALCIFAYEVLAKTGNIDIILEISKALGTNGMIGGQVVDIESEGKEVTLETVKYIHDNKTAALIRASVVMGAQLAGASKSEIEKLETYGNAIGLAFQVIDDILDITSTTEVLGKDAGSDLERGKATWPALTSLEESKRYAHELTATAKKSVAFLGDKAEMLIGLADYLEGRID